MGYTFKRKYYGYGYKLWVDQGIKLYSKRMPEWLDSNNILRYSKYNEGKSVIAEKYIKTLKAKLFRKSW